MQGAAPAAFSRESRQPQQWQQQQNWQAETSVRAGFECMCFGDFFAGPGAEGQPALVLAYSIFTAFSTSACVQEDTGPPQVLGLQLFQDTAALRTCMSTL